VTAQNTRKPFGGRGSAPDLAEGAYSAPTNPLVSGEGLAVPSPRTPSPLSALRASPLLPHSKIRSDAVEDGRVLGWGGQGKEEDGGGSRERTSCE